MDERNKLQSIAVNEKHAGAAMLREALTTCNKTLVKNGIVLASCFRNVKTMLSRLEASANKEGLQQQCEVLPKTLGKVEACSDFVSFMAKLCKDLDSARPSTKARFPISEDQGQ